MSKSTLMVVTELGSSREEETEHTVDPDQEVFCGITFGVPGQVCGYCDQECGGDSDGECPENVEVNEEGGYRFGSHDPYPVGIVWAEGATVNVVPDQRKIEFTVELSERPGTVRLSLHQTPQGRLALSLPADKLNLTPSGRPGEFYLDS